MLGKISNIITVALITAMSILLALSNVHPRLGYCFWATAAVFIAHLALSVRRQKRLARLIAVLEARPGHFFIDTPCLLDINRLSENFDETTRMLLMRLAGGGRQDRRLLKPGLEKLIKRLKRIARHHPYDPGPPAFKAWSVAILGLLSAQAEQWEEDSPAAGIKSFQKACDLYAKAARLAPEDGGIAADWGLALERRAETVDGGERLSYLKVALKQYELAAHLDAGFREAWRGQGRILNLLAQEAGSREAEEMLTAAVNRYETARHGHSWDADFYEDFGEVVQNLAQLNGGSRALNYCRYAARLFILAAEKNDSAPGPFFKAGQALHQAGNLSEDPRKTGGLYQEALDYLRQAADLDPRDPWIRLTAARCLTELAKLDDEEDYADQRLEAAAGLCALADAAAPREEEILSEWANILSLMAENSPERAEELWSEAAKKYEMAAACPDVPEDRAAVNWHNWAYTLTCLAEVKPALPKRRKLLRRAARKYEKAAELNGDNGITLENWGDVLGYQAELTDDPAEAARLHELAAEKYQRAAELHPRRSGPWKRWSAALQERARAEKTPGRRREIWQSALEKLERGVQAEPDDPETWIMWGRLLGELYWEGPEYEYPLLVAGAIEKYEKALHLDPGDDQTWNLLGRVRLDGANLPPEVAVGGGALSVILAAEENFKTACELNPTDADHWSEWGRAYFKAAQLLDNDASALAALAQAREKYETAVALAPDNSDYHTGLSHVLYQWAWRLEETEQKRNIFQKAYHHCGEAGRLAPHDPVVWRNWAKIAEALAVFEKDPRKSFDWQNEADEKHYHADTLETPGLRRH